MHMTLNYEVFKFTKYQLDIVPSIFLSAFLGCEFFIIECYYMYLYVLSNLEWPNWLQVTPLTIYLYILSNYVFSWLPKVGIEPMTIICIVWDLNPGPSQKTFLGYWFPFTGQNVHLKKTRHRQKWPVSPYPRVQESELSMIHNKGPQFSSSIPSPMEKTGIVKYINYYFITCQILNIYKSRFFKVTYTQNGGLSPSPSAVR